MKKFINISLSICLGICLAIPTAQGQTITDVHNVSITTYTQEQTQWCWAGCTRMVDWSYSTVTPPSQCTIVNKANDQCDSGSCCSTLNGTRPSACTTPASSNFPNNMGSCNGSLAWLINNYAGANTFASGSKTYSTVSSNLTNKKMMVARWGWTSGGGHFVVIYGCYQFNYVGQVSYANPASGSKVTESHSYFNSNSSRTWTHTITMNGGTVRREIATQMTAEELGGLYSIYPNPTIGVVTIQRTDNSDDVLNYSIKNALGQIIAEESLDGNQKQLSIDLKSQFGSGVYFMNIQMNGAQTTEKIIVQ